MLLTVGVYGRVHFHSPILDAQDPELSARNAPSFWEAHNGIVVVAPYPRSDSVRALVPGIDRRAHRGAIGAVKCNQDIRVVVAGRGKAPSRLSEHVSETGPRTHGRDVRSVVEGD